MYKIFTKTLFVGKKLVYEPICQSTNDLACQFADSAPVFEGAVFVAGGQRAGRGQRGNVWESAPGQNLTFSILFSPSFLGVSEQFYLSAALSLGIARFLKEQFRLPATVKWPNDIMVGDKKICGMLIENSIKGAAISRSVAGIGLNVNQTAFTAHRAVSLAMLTGTEHRLPELLENLCKYLETSYLMLKQGRKEKVLQEYEEALFRKGEGWDFAEPSGLRFKGLIKGVMPDGRLQIESMDGTLRQYYFKEISFLDFIT